MDYQEDKLHKKIYNVFLSMINYLKSQIIVDHFHTQIFEYLVFIFLNKSHSD